MQLENLTLVTTVFVSLMFSPLEIEMFQMIVMANLNNAANSSLNKNKAKEDEKEDLVASWTVPLCDKEYVVEFEHGTTSGKRVITVNGTEILRRDWMFRLVGDETFPLGPKHTCMIRVYPKPAFSYSYHLHIDGLEIEEFIQKQKNTVIIWNIKNCAKKHIRVTLEKPTLDIWVDGEKVETEGEFTDNGTKTNFPIKDHIAYIVGKPSGNKKDYIQYELYYNDIKVEEEK